jgi:selenocysteine lyase/cysteine desulfurase
VGVSAEEIGFLNSTSGGENLVVRSLGLVPGDNVVIDELHYMTTFVLYKHLEKSVGIEVRIAKATDGAVQTEAVAPLVDQRTRLISVAWVSHQNGFRHDMRPLADLAHSHGAYLYSDAVQAVGMFPMSLPDEGVDFITSGTYKWLLASFGVAPFFVRASLLDEISPDRLGHLHVERDLGDHRYQLYRSAKKYEYASLAFGPIYQLGAALDFLEGVGVDRIESHTVALAQKLRAGLVERGFQVVTPEGNRSSIVAFINPQDAETATRLFEQEKIRVSLRENGTQIRAGVALFNNASEIQQFLEVVEKLA